jgi:hypothetical protein
MKHLILYSNDNSTLGQIILAQNIQHEAILLDVSAIDVDLKYIHNEELTDRPEMEITINETELNENEEQFTLITGIPEGTSATYGDETFIVNSGFIEFITNTPGEHSVLLQKWPFLDKRIFIYAN